MIHLYLLIGSYFLRIILHDTTSSLIVLIIQSSLIYVFVTHCNLLLFAGKRLIGVRFFLSFWTSMLDLEDYHPLQKTS